MESPVASHDTHGDTENPPVHPEADMHSVSHETDVAVRTNDDTVSEIPDMEKPLDEQVPESNSPRGAEPPDQASDVHNGAVHNDTDVAGVTSAESNGNPPDETPIDIPFSEPEHNAVEHTHEATDEHEHDADCKHEYKVVMHEREVQEMSVPVNTDVQSADTVPLSTTDVSDDTPYAAVDTTADANADPPTPKTTSDDTDAPVDTTAEALVDATAEATAVDDPIDATTDVSPDITPETAPETAPEAAPEATLTKSTADDTGDAVEDVPSDVIADAVVDNAAADGTIDAASDAGPDVSTDAHSPAAAAVKCSAEATAVSELEEASEATAGDATTEDVDGEADDTPADNASDSPSSSGQLVPYSADDTLRPTSPESQLRFRSSMRHYLAAEDTSATKPRQMLAGAAGTGAFVGAKPFLNKNKYVPGSAAGMETDEDGEAMQEFMGVLSKYVKDCERGKRYLEAEIGQKRLRELREGELSRRVDHMRQRHVTEQVELQGAYASEMAAFDRSWRERLVAFENDVHASAQALQQKHERAMVQLRAELTMKLEARPRFSRQLLELRRVEESLAKAKDFVGAQQVRVVADRLEDEEREAMRVNNSGRVNAAEDRLRNQHRAEAQAMRQRVEITRDNLLRKRQQDLDRYVQRYHNILATLAQKQRGDTAKLQRQCSATRSRDSPVPTEAPTPPPAKSLVKGSLLPTVKRGSASRNSTTRPVRKPLSRSSSVTHTSSRATTAPNYHHARAPSGRATAPASSGFARTSSGQTLYSASFASAERSVPLAAAAHRLDGPDNYSHAYHAGTAADNQSNVVLPPLASRSSPPPSEAQSPTPASFPRYAATRAPTPAFDHLAAHDSSNEKGKSHTSSASRLNSAPMRARNPSKTSTQKTLQTQRSGASITKAKANAIMAYSSAGGRSGSPQRRSTSQLHGDTHDSTQSRSSRRELLIDQDEVPPAHAIALLCPDSP